MGYATPNDFLKYGLPQQAVESFTVDDIQSALDAASSLIDGYLANQYTLPLIAPYPVSMVQKACHLAQFDLVAVRGFDPNLGSHVTVRMRYEDAISWCKDIASAKVTLAQAIDSETGEDRGGPVVVQPAPGMSGVLVLNSRPSARGW